MNAAITTGTEVRTIESVMREVIVHDLGLRKIESKYSALPESARFSIEGERIWDVISDQLGTLNALQEEVYEMLDHDANRYSDEWLRVHAIVHAETGESLT